MGPAFENMKIRNARSLTWNILIDPVPNNEKLQTFASNRWCMALAGLFRIYHITQPEARKVVRRVRELTCDEMLWAQTVFFRGNREPWLGTWDALIDGT